MRLFGQCINILSSYEGKGPGLGPFKEDLLESPKHGISDPKDIENLIRSFYGKMREHGTLGPIFNQIFTDWESHFELLIDFW